MVFQTTLTPELIERYTDQRSWLGRTITDYLDEAAERTTLLLVHHCDTRRVPLPSSDKGGHARSARPCPPAWS
jgi:hypothetical protein